MVIYRYVTQFPSLTRQFSPLKPSSSFHSFGNFYCLARVPIIAKRYASVPPSSSQSIPGQTDINQKASTIADRTAPIEEKLKKVFPKETEIPSLQKEKYCGRGSVTTQSYSNDQNHTEKKLSQETHKLPPFSKTSIDQIKKKEELMSNIPKIHQKILSNVTEKQISNSELKKRKNSRWYYTRRIIITSIEILLLGMGVAYFWENLPPAKKWIQDKNPSIAQKLDAFAATLGPFTTQSIESISWFVQYLLTRYKTDKSQEEKIFSLPVEQLRDPILPGPRKPVFQPLDGTKENVAQTEKTIDYPKSGGSEVINIADITDKPVEVGTLFSEVERENNEKSNTAYEWEDLQTPDIKIEPVFRQHVDETRIELEADQEIGQSVFLSDRSPVDDTNFERITLTSLVKNQQEDKASLTEKVEEEKAIFPVEVRRIQDQTQESKTERLNEDEAPTEQTTSGNRSIAKHEPDVIAALTEAIQRIAEKSAEAEQLLKKNFELEIEQREVEWKKLTEALIEETEEEIRERLESETSLAIDELKQNFMEERRRLLLDIATIEGQAKAFDQAFDKVVSQFTRALQHCRYLHALLRIENNLSSCQPIGPILEELQSVCQDDEFIQTVIDAIPLKIKKRIQNNPVVPIENLARQFENVYSDALQAAFVPREGGLVGHLKATILRMVYSFTGISPSFGDRSPYTDYTSPRRSLAILERAAYYSRHGNIRDCQYLMNSLTTGLPKDVSKGWINETEVTITIQDVLDLLRSHLKLQNLTMTPGTH